MLNYRLVFILSVIALLCAFACSSSAQVTSTPSPTHTTPPTGTLVPLPPITPSNTPTPTQTGGAMSHKHHMWENTPTQTGGPPVSTLLPTATQPVLQSITNVPYIVDGHARQKLDVYLPGAGTEPYPTLFMIHGGNGDKRDLSNWARYFVDRGYAAISINHRKAPDDVYPAAVQDTFCALAWTHAHASEYGLDTQHIVALGHSAGGTLVAMLGVVDDPALFMADCPHALPAENWVQGVIPFTGIFDYAKAAAAFGGLRSYTQEYLGATLDENPDLWAQASPITWVSGDEPPFLLIHGQDDESISPDQSKDFAAALRAAGVEVDVFLVPNADHMAIIRGKQSFETVEEFLKTLQP